MKRVLLHTCTASIVSIFAFFSAQPAFASEPATKHSSSTLAFSTVRDKALSFIKSKELTVFAEFDHAKNATDVKLSLPPTTVIVFGSPLVGTKLMQAFPGIGMELPLKILISQNKDGKVTLQYPNLAVTFAPYGVKKDNPVLGKMQGLLDALAKNATE